MIESSQPFFGDYPIGKIADLCTLVKSQCDPRISNAKRYVGLEHIDPGSHKINRYGSPGSVVSSKTRFEKGDILYGKLRPYLDKAALADADGICSTDILVLRPESKVSAGFLLSIIHSKPFIDFAIATTNGVNHPRTSWAGISEFKLGIPPLPEQRKIAAVLGKVREAVEVEEALARNARDLKKSLMRQLFTHGLHGEPTKETEIGIVPERWERRAIGSLGTIVTGSTPKTNQREFYDGGAIAFIAPGDLGQSMRIRHSEKKITEKGLEECRVLPRNTPLFVCIGSTIGKVGITVESQSATNQQINALIPAAAFEGEFLAYLLEYNSAYIASAASPSPVPIMSKGKFSSVEIWTTLNVKDQREIARILRVVDDKIAVHEAKRDAYRDLFKTLLHQLMTAEIRVHDLAIDTKEVGP